MRKYKLVPIEPTEEMLTASQCECGNADERDGYITYDYTAMLAASPPASQDVELVQKIGDAISSRDTFRMWNGLQFDMACAVLMVLEGNQ